MRDRLDLVWVDDERNGSVATLEGFCCCAIHTYGPYTSRGRWTSRVYGGRDGRALVWVSTVPVEDYERSIEAAQGVAERALLQWLRERDALYARQYEALTRDERATAMVATAHFIPPLATRCACGQPLRPSACREPEYVLEPTVVHPCVLCVREAHLYLAWERGDRDAAALYMLNRRVVEYPAEDVS